MRMSLSVDDAISSTNNGRSHVSFQPPATRELGGESGSSGQAAGRSEHRPAEECLDSSETLHIRVLAVEDSRSDLLVLENAFAEVASVRFELTAAGHVREARALLETNQFDVVLTDLGLPDSSGLDTYIAIQEAAKDLPVIVITGLSDERTGIRAMRQGAQDYFVKGHYLENGLIRAIRDAIERQRIEAAMRRDEERFRVSIESLLNGFALLSPRRGPDGATTEFNIDYINASGLNLRPSLRNVPLPLTLNDLFPDCHTTGLFDELVRVLGGGVPFTRECVFLFGETAHDLTAPCYDFRATRSRDCVALSWRDVAPRLRLEAQVFQSEKMNSVGQLIGGVAHEFNNLLTIIHGHADGLRDSAFLSTQLVDPVREVSAAASRATTLIDQLLSFSRQKPLLVADIDLNEAVAQMSGMLGRILGESIRLRVEFWQPAPRVQGDGGMIEQVLLNLAVNSRDSMPNGGELTITTSICNVREDELLLQHDVTPGPFVCLAVQDNGSGIAAEHLSKIFEPFFSTKEGGQGLGLATVYGIVKQHKGWLKAESEIGCGTTFKVYLPHHEGQPIPTFPEGKIKPPEHRSETILLVEDEENIRHLVKMFLEGQGYHILEAGDGVEALAIWQKGLTTIDLLLTDLVMPEGVSGQELARQLQRDQPGLRVIFSSGYSRDLFGKNSFLNPDTNFLQKPYRLNILAEMIRHCLDRPASADSPTEDTKL